jgi:hypothetical protein
MHNIMAVAPIDLKEKDVIVIDTRNGKVVSVERDGEQIYQQDSGIPAEEGTPHKFF